MDAFCFLLPHEEKSSTVQKIYMVGKILIKPLDAKKLNFLLSQFELNLINYINQNSPFYEEKYRIDSCSSCNILALLV